MPTVVIIPVKSFRFGMRRLAGSIADQGRYALGQALAAHVAETAETADLLPLFVTGDPEVAQWVAAQGFPSIPESGHGLSAAASAGVEWATRSTSRWLVLHSDLPLLRESDLQALLGSGPTVIAPSSDGGTSAICAAEPIEFAFGPGSFHRHLARLREPEVVATTGLLHDIDSPSDLEWALIHPLGAWLAGVVT